MSPFYVLSEVNRAHAARTVVFESLTNFFRRIHNEEAVTCDRFIQRLSADQQYASRRRIFERCFNPDLIPISIERNHVAALNLFRIAAEAQRTLDDVCECIEVMRYRLNHQ